MIALALAEDDVALHVELHRHPLVLDRPSGKVRLLHARGPDHQPIGRNVQRAGLAAESVDDDVHPGIDDRDPLVAVRTGLKPLELDGHVAAGKDANPPPTGTRRRAAGGRNRRECRSVGEPARSRHDLGQPDRERGHLARPVRPGRPRSPAACIAPAAPGTASRLRPIRECAAPCPANRSAAARPAFRPPARHGPARRRC